MHWKAASFKFKDVSGPAGTLAPHRRPVLPLDQRSPSDFTFVPQKAGIVFPNFPRPFEVGNGLFHSRSSIISVKCPYNFMFREGNDAIIKKKIYLIRSHPSDIFKRRFTIQHDRYPRSSDRPGISFPAHLSLSGPPTLARALSGLHPESPDGDFVLLFPKQPRYPSMLF